MCDRMYYVVCGGFVCVIECIISSVVPCLCDRMYYVV